LKKEIIFGKILMVKFMNVVRVTDLGFCFGVKSSIQIALNELHKKDKQIYILGMLVHNTIVCNSLKQMGIKMIELDELSQVDKLNSKIILSAHGTNPELKNELIRKGYSIIDSTCKIVEKNKLEIDRYFDEGFDIIYIGKRNHPESIAVEDKVHLVESVDDCNNLNIDNNRIVILNQTTMTQDNIDKLSLAIINKYPNALNVTSMCPITKERQEKLLSEVILHHDYNDYWIVFGDKSSNNTNKLFEIIKGYTNNCYLVSSIRELELLSLRPAYTIYVTSGTSTPMGFIEKAINYLEEL